MKLVIFTRELSDEELKVLDAKYPGTYSNKFFTQHKGDVVYIDPRRENLLSYGTENYARSKLRDQPDNFQRCIPQFEVQLHLKELVPTDRIPPGLDYDDDF